MNIQHARFMSLRTSGIIKALSLLLLLLPACPQHPKPVYMIFFLDSSASAAVFRQDAIENIRSLCFHMDFARDWVSIYRLSEDVYSLYTERPRAKALTPVLEKYSAVAPSQRGTAYGIALARGLKEAAQAHAGGYTPAIVFLGDGADEQVSGGGNIDWDSLKDEVKQLPADGVLAFLFISPKLGDRYRQTIGDHLGRRLLLLDPLLARDHGGARQIRDLVQEVQAS